jgi:hypothetical protein
LFLPKRQPQAQYTVVDFSGHGVSDKSRMVDRRRLGVLTSGRPATPS